MLPASVDGTVCVFLEPIALYHARDLYEDGDDGWCSVPNDIHVPIGAARTYLDGTDLTLVTWGNGLHMSLRVARRLKARGVDVRVLDLRWLAPLPIDNVLAAASATGVHVVDDEAYRGVSEVPASLIDAGLEVGWPEGEQGHHVPLETEACPVRGRSGGCAPPVDLNVP
jgi:2-oxoisovalerate dehydrogenase E1 component